MLSVWSKMASCCKEVKEFARRVRGRTAGRGRRKAVAGCAGRRAGDLRALMQCRRVIDHAVLLANSCSYVTARARPAPCAAPPSASPIPLGELQSFTMFTRLHLEKQPCFPTRITKDCSLPNENK